MEHPQLNCGSIGMLFRKDCGHLTLILESGLYKLIMRSDKPEAATFQDWVTQEVLPSIRKTGSYGTQERLALAGPVECGTLPVARRPSP